MRTIAKRLPTVPENELPFPAPVIDHLLAFLPAYEELTNEVKKAMALQTEATAAVRPLLRTARIWVGQGYQNIVDAVTRGALPRATLSAYGLTLSAQGARMRRGEQYVITAAERLRSAEEYRVSIGGQPMAFPSLAEIMAHVDAFRTANLLQSERKFALSDAQRNLRQANAEAKKLVLRLWNTIETAYDTGDRPSMRRKAREWGVIYSIAKGEKAEEGDAEE
jgi:hypothetical protein